MIKFKSKLALLGVPAVLAFAAVSYGSVVAFTTVNPAPPAPAEAAEPAESTAPGAADVNEPGVVGSGYADTDNVNANTQQEGAH